MLDLVLVSKRDPGTLKIIEILLKNTSFQRNRVFERESLLDFVLATFWAPFSEAFGLQDG